MRGLVGGALAVVFAMGGAQASAADITRSTLGPTYFHRAGADLAAQDRALDYCLQQTATTSHGLRGPSNMIPMGLLDRLVEAEYNKSRDVRVEDRGFAANVENCMVVTGWTVMALGKSEGETLAKLPPGDLRERLGSMIGAETPTGLLARRFENDIVAPKNRWLVEPSEYDNLPLNLRARGYADWHGVRIAAKPPPPPPTIAPDFPTPPGTAALAADQWNALPDGTTAILFTVARVQDRIDEPVLILSREGPDPRYPAWHRDGKIDLVTAGMGFNKKVRVGGLIETTYLLRVPPGRWRVLGLRSGRVVTSFCLGAPSFVAEDGSVTWVGRLAHGETPQLAPDVRLETAARVTMSAPNLQRRLKPAKWENGSQFPCDGSYIYAFEAPGAPFLPGYANGSAAQPRPAAP